jgi:hypothetical protein
MGTAWHVSPLDADSQGAIVQFVTPELLRRKTAAEAYLDRTARTFPG